MKSGQFLQSKVGRRIFLLFVACALLPITVLSIVSTTFVTRQMEIQSRERLHQTAKSAGMELFRVVEVAGDDLALIAVFLEETEDPSRLVVPGRTAGKLTRSFQTLELVSMDDTRLPILGTSDLSETTLRDIRARALERDVVLASSTGADGAREVYLGTPVGRGTADEKLLVGAIHRKRFQEIQQLLPEGMDLMILGAERRPLFASNDALPVPSQQEFREIRQTAIGELDWSVDAERHMASYWSVFLGPRFGASDWKVLLTEPRADPFDSLRQFGKLLPLFVLLCLMIVVLMSMAQIRKSLVPLHKLQEGTERIARRRFDSKVEVNSGDEFESLAESFNAMASDLDRQFRTLTTLAEIDRALLSTVDEDRVIHTILDRIADYELSDGAAVAVTDVGTLRSMTVHVRWPAGIICDTTDRVAFEPDEGLRLQDAAKSHVVWEGTEIPGYLRELESQGIRHCLVLPLPVRQGLLGCIALGSRERATYREEDLQDLRRLANQAAVALSNARLVDELERTNWETLRALARAVDANSPWTAGHSERVTAMALRLGKRLGLAEDELAVIHRGGLLHDIGKIGVPSEILNKPGRLTDEEMAVMQSHPTIGARILEPISAYAREIPIVLYHHERFDGRGYPEGLAGEAIPLNARVLAVADVFDALISERPYRKPWELEQVIAFIRDGAGTQFDPGIVPVFLQMMAREVIPLAGRNYADGVRELLEAHAMVHP